MRELTSDEEAVVRTWWRNANFIRMAMATRFLVGCAPVSVLLVGEPGTGKTDLLKLFSDHDGQRFRWQTDVTQQGLSNALRDVFDEGLKGLVVPDLGTIMNKSKAVAQRAITYLAGAMAEGVGRVDQGGTKFFDFQGAQLGLFSGITERDAHLNIDLLQTNAFLTRCVLVKHHFSRRQNRTIRYLNSEGMDFFAPVPGVWPLRDVVIHCDDMYDDVALQFSELVHEKQPIVYAAQRTINVFRSLLMASAMLRGSSTVEALDVERLEEFRSIWDSPPWMPHSSRVVSRK